MGKVVEKKKKKGRPSLLDLQKRNLKQQQEEELLNQQLLQPQLRRSHKFQNPNPNDNNNSHTPARRSTRRNTNLDADEDVGAADDDGDQSTRIRRREKKLKLVSKLPDSSVNSGSFNSGSDSNPEDDNDATASHKKRKIESIGDRSGQRKDDTVSEQQGRGSANPTSTTQDTRLDDGPSTPLPDKKLLLFILDRLQKKDTYGVFADPVDPEELPDYHEVVKNPIDFSTIRKKLVNRAYADLEQFEKDVFLLCSNAMQYNAPDTIYFRQARSIQELAKKNFENLRQDSDDNDPEPEPEVKIVRRGRPPTKNLKRPVGRPSLERSVSGSPGATLATGGETSTRLNNDVRRANGLDKYASPDPFGRINYGSRQGDAYISWSADKYDRTDEIFGSMAKGISMKHGKKPIIVDENRRNTYSESCSSAGVRDPSSAMTTFRLQDKHLVPVGLHTEHGYARSLVRFAAKLGPVAWKVATKKIERCLPPGVKFGPGWVGENDSSSLTSVHPSTSSAAPPLMSESNGSRSSDREGSDSLQKQVPSNQSLPDNRQSKTILPVRKSSPGSCSGAAEAVQTCNPQPPFSTLNNSGTSATRPTPSFPVHQQSMLQPRVNGVNGAYDFTFPTHMGKLIRSAGIWPHQSATENDSEDTKLSVNLNPEKRVDCLSDSAAQQKPVQSDPLMVGSGPPDLNVGFQSPGSPSGKAESGQPELALQL